MFWLAKFFGADFVLQIAHKMCYILTMAISDNPDRYLKTRGSVFHYYRRVPRRFSNVDDRGTIRHSLKTNSLEIARIRRDGFETADDEYWASLVLSETESQSGKLARSAMAKRYKSAQARALASGFVYKPVEELAQPENLEEVVDRLLALKTNQDGNIAPQEAEAILGGIEEPVATVSEALELYINEIAIDDQLGKSDRQKYQWQKVKRLSAAYFVDVIGDIPLSDISRDHALQFQKWWKNRILAPPKGEKAISPNTVNRHIGNMRLLYRAYFQHIGEEERQNPFRNLFLKAKSRVEVPAFDDEWVRTKILEPGKLLGLRRELQLITYILIETGCRPSEIINLKPDDIRLDADVPHIAIRPTQKRQIKTESSIRDIPLVGVALQAALRAPDGFEHYHDRNELFSANMMKAFRTRKLFPTANHVIYSFRHSFEKRMQEANIDYGLRCLLMGHANSRPSYGDGGSLEYRRDELLKIAHPFDQNIFERFDASMNDA